MKKFTRRLSVPQPRLSEPGKSWARPGASPSSLIRIGSRERLVVHQGHRQQLVSDQVARATLRLLQEKTRAELYAVDIGMEAIYANVTDGSSTQLMPVFHEFNAAIYRVRENSNSLGSGTGWRRDVRAIPFTSTGFGR